MANILIFPEPCSSIDYSLVDGRVRGFTLHGLHAFVYRMQQDGLPK
jgi:hypothetical protein